MVNVVAKIATIVATIKFRGISLMDLAIPRWTFLRQLDRVKVDRGQVCINQMPYPRPRSTETVDNFSDSTENDPLQFRLYRV